MALTKQDKQQYDQSINNLENSGDDTYYLQRMQSLIAKLQNKKGLSLLTPTELHAILNELNLIRRTLMNYGHDLHLYDVEVALRKLQRVLHHFDVRGTLHLPVVDDIANLLSKAHASMSQHRIFYVLDKQHKDDDTKDQPAYRDLGINYVLQRLDHMKDFIRKEGLRDVPQLVRFGQEFVMMRDKFLRNASTAKTRDNSKTIGPLVQDLMHMHNLFASAQAIALIDKHDIEFTIVRLTGIQKRIEEYRRAEILDDEDSLKTWIEHANRDLVDRLQKEDFMALSLNTVIERFLLTWDDIINDIMDGKIVAIQPNSEWWQMAYQIGQNIVTMVTRDDRLIYVGIGLVVMSFFTYFLSMSA